jgi:hypothetical protein
MIIIRNVFFDCFIFTITFGDTFAAVVAQIGINSWIVVVIRNILIDRAVPAILAGYTIAAVGAQFPIDTGVFIARWHIPNDGIMGTGIVAFTAVDTIEVVYYYTTGCDHSPVTSWGI